jgi:hypothetical protein
MIKIEQLEALQGLIRMNCLCVFWTCARFYLGGFFEEVKVWWESWHGMSYA